MRSTLRNASCVKFSFHIIDAFHLNRISFTIYQKHHTNLFQTYHPDNNRQIDYSFQQNIDYRQRNFYVNNSNYNNNNRNNFRYDNNARNDRNYDQDYNRTSNQTQFQFQQRLLKIFSSKQFS